MRVNRNIRYNMTRVDTIDFTSEQKHAIQSIYEFVVDSTQSTFGLYGYAGSGKTTTLVEFVSYLLANRYINRIVFVAPTNKAVNVIRAKFKGHLKKLAEKIMTKQLDNGFNFDEEIDLLESHGMMIRFMTIHKLLMFKTDYTVNGDMIFVRDKKQGSLIPTFELVIVDECSMIGVDMVDSIFEEIGAKSHSSPHVPKIIFSGDPAQLPPVNEIDSSIFCKTTEALPFGAYMEAMGYGKANNPTIDPAGVPMVLTTAPIVPMVPTVPRHLLEQRYHDMIGMLAKMRTVLMRQQVRARLGSVVLVCMELRKWIGRDRLPRLHRYKDMDGVCFYSYQQGKTKTSTMWFNQFIESLGKGNQCIIVTWTNKQTDQYNNTIRRHMFRGKKIDKFEINDILMLSEFYGLDLGDDFVKQKLYTSEQIRVIGTKRSEVPLNRFATIVTKTMTKLKNSSKLIDMCDQLIKGLNQTYCDLIRFSAWVLTVQRLGEDSKHSMTLVVIDDVDSERYKKIKSETCHIVGNFCNKILSMHRTAPKQVEKVVVKPLWKQWNKIFVEPFANVNYGYSITCHKAQGSGFFDVFVDLDDILQNTQRPDEAKKCAYTAATRTSNQLHLLV